MNNVPILMPQMGQSVAEGAIVKWCKKVGDPVAADEIIVEIESDKINFEVESPAAGVLASCLKGEGEKASVGEVIGLIAVRAAVGASVPPPDTAPAGKPHAGADTEQVLVAADEGTGAFDFSSLPDITRDWFSPYVLRLAMQNGISLHELQNIRGSGRQGRVTRDDLLKHMAKTSREPAAPAVRGAVLPENAGDLGEVIPMTTIRRTIADHMVQSIHTSAHVTMVHAVDMTPVVSLRDRIKDRFHEKFGVKLTYTAVMIFVTGRVLREFPTLNASVYGPHIVRRKEVNIGCAVALQDESLVVPVVKDADKKPFPEIARDLDRLIQLARTKSLQRSDIDGGTFSLSNFGSFGSLIGTPIINQPQVAILGMGAVFKAPVVIGDEIKIRDQLYLSFSFDHRVIDGAMGGRFLNAIQRMTESLSGDILGVAGL